jgi:hypothetical protein
LIQLSEIVESTSLRTCFCIHNKMIPFEVIHRCGIVTAIPIRPGPGRDRDVVRVIPRNTPFSLPEKTLNVETSTLQCESVIQYNTANYLSHRKIALDLRIGRLHNLRKGWKIDYIAVVICFTWLTSLSISPNRRTSRLPQCRYFP